MMRCDEPGWVRIGRFDRPHRRCLWFRIPEGDEPEYLELCAGREGDDDYARVERDNPVFQGLLEVLLTAEFGLAMDAPEELEPEPADETYLERLSALSRLREELALWRRLARARGALVAAMVQAQPAENRVVVQSREGWAVHPPSGLPPEVVGDVADSAERLRKLGEIDP